MSRHANLALNKMALSMYISSIGAWFVVSFAVGVALFFSWPFDPSAFSGALFLVAVDTIYAGGTRWAGA